MQKLKFENILLLVALVLGGLFLYRTLHRPLPSKSSPSDGPSQDAMPAKSSTKSSVAVNLPANVPEAPAPKIPTQPTVSPQTEQSAIFKEYRALLQNRNAGMDRLHLIEQMKKTESTETVVVFLLNEVMNNGPQKNLSEVENHERRNIVGVAYSMFLDQCKDFNDCAVYAAAALARHEDPETRNDLYQQTTEKFHQNWQQDLFEKEMKRYYLEVKRGAPK